MRKIRYIVVHCTAGNQRAKAADVIAYHTVTLGWRRPGYHYIIEADGTVVAAVPEEEPSNGVKGRNAYCINVSYIGGVDTSRQGLPPVDNRTAAQKAALIRLLTELHGKYPEAEIVGHRDFPEVKKACPSFDARAEYECIMRNAECGMRIAELKIKN